MIVCGGDGYQGSYVQVLCPVGCQTFYTYVRSSCGGVLLFVEFYLLL